MVDGVGCWLGGGVSDNKSAKQFSNDADDVEGFVSVILSTQGSSGFCTISLLLFCNVIDSSVCSCY